MTEALRNRVLFNKIEFNNVYDNFLKIDKKFLRYDDTNVTYRTKIALLESKGNKLELQLIKFTAYVDEETENASRLSFFEDSSDNFVSEFFNRRNNLNDLNEDTNDSNTNNRNL